MLLRILADGSLSVSQKLLYVFIIAFCVLFSLSIHELSHGLAAYLMGDMTAKNSGRLSLNPFRHMDPIGAICLFLFGFGWARPVPVNPWSFKQKRAGMAITALAGPLSNFIVAFLAQIGVAVLGKMSFSSDASFSYNLASASYIVCIYLASVNIGLGLFNLIPIPPLDGSKVLNAFLPERIYFKIMEYERYGFIILIVVINMPFFGNILAAARAGILSFFGTLIASMGL